SGPACPFPALRRPGCRVERTERHAKPGERCSVALAALLAFASRCDLHPHGHDQQTEDHLQAEKGPGDLCPGHAAALLRSLSFCLYRALMACRSSMVRRRAL